MEKYYSGKAIIKVDDKGMLIEENNSLDEDESYPSTSHLKNILETLVNQEDSFCIKSTKYNYACFTKNKVILFWTKTIMIHIYHSKEEYETNKVSKKIDKEKFLRELNIILDKLLLK